jgi:hemolysin III
VLRTPYGIVNNDYAKVGKEMERENVDVYGLQKPKLRGFIHAAALPLALAGCIVLICVAPTIQTKIACIIYMVTSIMLFATSAVYHIFPWGKNVQNVLRRLDHANIFLIIAGTNTPIAIAVYEPAQRNLLLSIVWGSAILGLILHMVWINAPRALYTVIYIAIGFAPIVFAKELLRGGVPVLVLIISGGVAYIAGAVIYALRKPNISKKWYGFHELFHSLTVVGYSCHMVAAFFAVLSLR